jgi:hypothetical protein
VAKSTALLLALAAVAVIVPVASAEPRTSSTYLTGPDAGDPVKIASDYVRGHRAELGLAASDLSGMGVSDSYASAHTGATHVYFEQRHRGLEVHNAVLNVNVARDGSVVSVGNRFFANANAAAKGADPGRTAKQGVEDAARHLGLNPEGLALKQETGGAAREAVFNEAGISTDPITARLVYQPVGAELRLAWELEIAETDGEHWWNVRVDASSGELLDRSDYFTHASYHVFPHPAESPDETEQTTVAEPADADASPFGWHDTNGAAGAEFTITRGNNVFAYTDTDANNKPDPGSSPDGGVSLAFGALANLTGTPSTYRAAAVTNLFYWNNVIHDVLEGYGFDEAAGNFQETNYSGAGRGRDAVDAEAQDGSGVNNADFGTPHDGKSPRMQMFEWTYPLPNLVVIAAPPAAAGSYGASAAVFGPPVTATGVTGAITLVNDGSAAPSVTDACEPLVGFPSGNIALLDRGACDFVVKVKNAQNAGATAAIVVQSSNGNPFTMGGTDASISIPSVMISKANGDLLKANQAGLTGTVKSGAGNLPPNRDSDLDAGVIAHEYGHGVSNRLTGGPMKVACLNNDEQMGEGWSDFLALALTARAGDTNDMPRGIATYLTWEPTNGVGIRPAPYSTSMSVNPVTYANVPTLAIPHAVGYAWASMLWEVYWNLVGAHGVNADVYGAWNTGGNNLAIQLVMDGMKLQPCSPGFVDGRDAILQADQLLTGGDNQCAIWRGFAKRGLGTGASQGSSKSTLDGTASTAVPAGC